MLRVLLPILIIGFTLYSFFDCARTDQDQVQKLPKWGWLLIILLFEFMGAVAWQFLGKPKGNRGPRGGGRGKIIPPDDDPDFLRKI